MTATWQPIRRSALYQKHLKLGAVMTTLHGWQVAAHFMSPDEEARHVREGVGICDVSWLGKLDVKGKGLDDGEWRMQNAKRKMQNVRVWQLARGHWLVTCEPPDLDAVAQELERQLAATDCAHVTIVTSVYAALCLAGPKARDVLSKLTELDLRESIFPNQHCAQTCLANVHAIVLRQELGDVLAYRLLVGREYGEYVWDVVMQAGQEFGIMPFGLEALRLLS